MVEYSPAKAEAEGSDAPILTRIQFARRCVGDYISKVLENERSNSICSVRDVDSSVVGSCLNAGSGSFMQ